MINLEHSSHITELYCNCNDLKQDEGVIPLIVDSTAPTLNDMVPSTTTVPLVI